MIKIIYIGNDDYMARLKPGDVFYAEPSEDGNGYFIKNKHDEELYIANHEALVY